MNGTLVFFLQYGIIKEVRNIEENIVTINNYIFYG